MEFVNRICPKCSNPNYMVSLYGLSEKYKYKCMNCNRYFNDEDFEKQERKEQEVKPFHKCLNKGAVMTELNKTIEGLETIREFFGFGLPSQSPVFEAYQNVLTDALAMLKEQEAVVPKQIVRKQCKKEHDDGSIDYFAEWYCPYCNSLILRGFDNPSIKFCYKCGKPITWEGR